MTSIAKPAKVTAKQKLRFLKLGAMSGDITPPINGSNKPKGLFSVRKLSVLALLLVVAVAGLYLGWNWKLKKIVLPPPGLEEKKFEPVAFDLEKMEKIPFAGSGLPQGFSAEIPFYPGAVAVEMYNLKDARLSKPSEAVVVLSSTALPEEIKSFYQEKLPPLGFSFIRGSDADDTDGLKTSAFSYARGVLVVQIETGSSNTIITLRQSDFLIRREIYGQ